MLARHCFLFVIFGIAVAAFGQTSDVVYDQTVTEGLWFPGRLAPSPGGGFFVTDQPGGMVFEYDAAGTLIGTNSVPELPVGVAVHPDGRIFVSRLDGAVGIYDASFTPLGTFDPSPLSMTAPNDLAVHPTTGEVYVTDSEEHQVLVFADSNGVMKLARAWGMQGSGLGEFQSPQAIAIDPDLNHVIVSDVDNFRVQVFDTAGVLQFKFGYRTLYAGSTEVAWFARSEGLAVDGCGNIYVADALMGTIRVFDATGQELDPLFTPAIGFGTGPGELRIPCDVMIDGVGKLYVASTNNAAVEIYQVSCTPPGPAPLGGLPGTIGSSLPGASGASTQVLGGNKPISRRQRTQPDNPVDIVVAMQSGRYVPALDLNFDRRVDATDLELAVSHFGAATVDDFLNMNDGTRSSYPDPLEPPHMIDIPYICGRCHSMDGLPGGMLSAEGQENLCVSCHTAGGRAMGAVIGGADKAESHPWGVAADSGGVPGPDPDSELALHLDDGDIRCGTCHNPHETEPGNAKYLRDSVLDGGLCGQCHVEVAQWQLAGHSDPEGAAWTHYDWSQPNRSACRRCHSGYGYIDFTEGLDAADQRGDFRVADCLVCHSTHGKAQDHELLRTYDVVTLPANGPDVTLTDVGPMATCMACHNGRYAPDDPGFTPHYLSGGVMLEGINGIDFGETLLSSPHKTLATCIDCHMGPTPAEGQPGAGKVGGHTFNVKVLDPEDPDFGFENVAACNIPSCHGAAGARSPELELTTLNRTAFGDYDGDGTIEGVQDETEGLMDLVLEQITTNGAVKLPSYPYWNTSGVDPGMLTLIEDAIWNWQFVENSGDRGVHNTAYAVGLLQVTYKALAGQDVPGAFLRYGSAISTYPETVVEIQSVNGGDPVSTNGAFTVDFTVKDDMGTPIAIGDLDRLRVYVSGPATNYQRVIEQDSNPAHFTQNPDNSYTYTAVDPFPTVYAPPENDSPFFGAADGELTGQPLIEGTYTVLIESRRSFGSVRKATDATFDFVVADNPLSPPALSPRQVVMQDACNACHLDLQLHGGGRFSVTGCVLCHTAGSEDLITAPDTTPGVTVKFGDMIHRLHRSQDLPRVTATANSGDPYRYIIIGHSESVNDFSDIGFPIIPAGVMDCDACHGGSAQAGQIYTAITRANCATCHDDIDFNTTGTVLDDTNPSVSGGLLTQAQLNDLTYRVYPGGFDHTFGNDTTCAGCHAINMFADVQKAHQHPTDDAQEGTNPAVEIVSVAGMTGGGGTYFQAGDFPEITFKLKDDTADPLQIVPGDGSTLNRLEVIVAGPTTLYQTIIPSQSPWNNSNLNVPGGNWIDNFAVDGTYTFISEDPLPADYPAQLNSIGEAPADQIFPFEEGWGQQYTAGGTPLDTGTYTVIVYGRRVTPTDGEREPFLTDTADIPFGAAGPITPYSGTVATASCNECHGVLAFHGNQREGVRSCLACHTAGTQDGGTTETVDLRVMVHKLHNARNLTDLPYELNGHSGIADFSDLLISAMPGEAAECEVCHVNDDWKSPPLRDNMRTWMVVCTSCHDAAETATHVDAATLAGTFVETCAACHGEGTPWSVERVHKSP